MEGGEGAYLFQAENVMKDMERRWNEGSCEELEARSDAVTYEILIEVWLKKSELERLESVQNAERMSRDTVDQFLQEYDDYGGRKRKEDLILDQRLFTSVNDA